MTERSSLFDDYGAYHRDRRNLVCHEIGIPLIVLGIVALLRLVVVPWWGGNLAALAVGLTVLYYVVAFAREHMAAVIVAAIGLLAIYYAAAYLTWPWAIAAFVAGWVFQFVGHAYEGKSPAFLTNLLHLLVGPLWVASHLVPRSASSSSAR
ncbi:MAG TPA: Mpo1-like protein [Candidatus Elarobacter sp.]|jgi:uncharacterized membrane protein YGL010W